MTMRAATTVPVLSASSRRQPIRQAILMRRRIAAVSAALVTACTNDGIAPIPIEDTAPDLAVLSSLTTADALAGLDREGRFAPTDETLPSGGADALHAVSLAVAFVRTHGKYFRSSIEEVAGRAIEFEALRALDRVYFAETPYEEPAKDLPIHVRARVGPVHIITFADDVGPAVVMSVSSYTAEFSVVDGNIKWPRYHGNQFGIFGVSPDGVSGPPPPPEAIAVDLTTKTGARIAERPAYVSLGYPWVPLVGAWRFVLDRPARVRIDDGGVLRTRELFVDPRGNVLVATSSLKDPYQGSGQHYIVRARPDWGRQLRRVKLLET